MKLRTIFTLISTILLLTGTISAGWFSGWKPLKDPTKPLREAAKDTKKTTEGWKPLKKPLDPAKKAAENAKRELGKATGGLSDVGFVPLEVAEGWFDGWKPFRKPLTPAENAIEDVSKTAQGAADWVKFFATVMLTNRHWPDGFPKQVVTPIANPSCEIGVSLGAINDALKLYKDEKFPLESGDDHVVIGDVTLGYDTNRKVYLINVSGGKVRYDFIFSNSLHVRSIDIEAIPQPRTTNGKLFVDFLARCTRFDVEDCPGEVDRLVAHLLNKGFAKSGGVIASVDVTKALSTPVELGTLSKTKATATVKEVVAFLEGRMLKVQADVTIAK